LIFYFFSCDVSIRLNGRSSGNFRRTRSKEERRRRRRKAPFGSLRSNSSSTRQKGHDFYDFRTFSDIL